jgi:hypothetical protein
MLLTNAIVAAICGSTLVSLPGFGQENPISGADVSIETSMPFVENTNADQAQVSISANYSLLGHPLFFNQCSGVELSFRQTPSNQTYSSGNGSTGVKSNSAEAFATYALQFPAKRWLPVTPARDLIPDPKTLAGTDMQARRRHLYGGANDFNVTQRSFARTDRRRVFNNSATFNMNSLNRLFINGEEPAVVFGYNF